MAHIGGSPTPAAVVVSRFGRQHRRSFGGALGTWWPVSSFRRDLGLEPCDTVGFEISRSTLLGLFHSVRQRVLDWTFQHDSDKRTEQHAPAVDQGNMSEELENSVIEYLEAEYLRNPSQRPARVCPEISTIMEKFSLTKEQCYVLAARLEALGIVDWKAKEAHGEFVRVLPSVIEAAANAKHPAQLSQGMDSMDVLISWSKTQSREIATVFHQWIPKVLPGVTPWMPDRNKQDSGSQNQKHPLHPGVGHPGVLVVVASKFLPKQSSVAPRCSGSGRQQVPTQTIFRFPAKPPGQTARENRSDHRSQAQRSSAGPEIPQDAL
jgi:hypothetical protein